MGTGSHAGVAVVGATGFLGSALARSLDGPGVHLYTRSRPVLASGRLPAELHTVATVVWAASRVNPQVAEERPDLVAQDEAALLDFLRALDTHGLSPRTVLLSSGGTVYGDDGAPFSETTPTRPVNAYGRAKVRLEQVLTEHAALPTVVRVANAYGPGQPAGPGQGVLAHWLRAVADGRPVTVFGALATARDYVAVQDVVAALVLLHEHVGTVPVVNVGSGRATTLGELLDVVRDVTGTPDLAVRHEPARGFDVPATWLDVGLAREVLGWEPRTSLRSGVAATWEWLAASVAR